MATYCDLVVNRWGARFMGRRFSCSVGRGGIGLKRVEGDNITPQGSFGIRQVLIRSDRQRLTNSEMIRLDEVWSNDPDDPAYNTMRRDRSYSYSHEHLRRSDPMYDIVADLDFNRETPRSGAGSAIFLHIWRKPRHPTAGCVAFSKPDLVWILSKWTSMSRVVTTR